MDCCEIICYTDLWIEKLRDYLRKVYPSYSNEYIDYCINHSNDRMPSLMVINEKGNVVGCHLFYCTKVMICGEVIDTQWGHDTFLDKEYRASMGLDFMLATHAKKGFGIGLTDVNEKLQRLLKEVFFKGAYNYYFVTWKIIFSPFQKLLGLSPALKHPKTIKVGKYIFRRVYEAKELNIPNNGFWLKGKFDIDFIRDASFLNNRFLRSQVHQYYMYALDSNEESSYFVVRKTSYRGIPTMTLSDYRYTDASLTGLIIRAVDKLAVKSNIGIILFLCGDDNMEKSMRGRIHHKTKEDFVTNMKLKPSLTYIVTGGDSDADFLK